MFDPGPCVYMHKIAVGPEAAGSIDITATPSQNLRWIAKAKGESVRDLTVVILDRERHTGLIAEVRASGARVKLITDGDLSAAIESWLAGAVYTFCNPARWQYLGGGQAHGPCCLVDCPAFVIYEARRAVVSDLVVNRGFVPRLFYPQTREGAIRHRREERAVQGEAPGVDASGVRHHSGLRGL